MSKIVFAVSYLLLTIYTPSQAMAQVASVSIPFVASNQTRYVTEKDQYRRFRIPGMVVAPDGSVLAFAEARRGNGGDPRTEENAPIDMVMRRSTDHGKTWEPMVVIDSGFQPDGKVDYGDPTPVVDSVTKAVFLVYGQMPDVGQLMSRYGQSADSSSGHHIVWVRKSTDNGKSWSDRRQIVYPDEPHETSDGLYWRMAGAGPGNGIQLQWQDRHPARNGRLVVPAKRDGSETPDGDTVVDPFVYYSDDHGDTWHVGNATDGPGANEDDVVELTDGSLLLDARQTSGTFRRRYLSNDGGEKWGPHQPGEIMITPVDTSMIRFSAKREGDDRDRILFSGPRGIGRVVAREHDEEDFGLTRNNLTVWTSYDEGETFVHPVRITLEMAGYSAMYRLADGAIGILVESASDQGFAYGDITFIRFEVSALEDTLRWER